LGLSIARSLMELHGGTLQIASRVGAGTCVSMALPPSRITWYGVKAASV
jgi:signal transduction histidine kinase